jgi:TolB protein
MKYLSYLLIFLSLFLHSLAESKVYIDINAPRGRKLPIAIQEFKNLGEMPSKILADDLRDVLISDLSFSGLFDLIDMSAYLEDIELSGLTASETDFRDWRIIGSQTLIKGGIRADNNGIIRVDIRLFDVILEKVLIGKRYFGITSDIRKIAHRFADEVIKNLTGERGIFATRLLFVSDISGSKEIYISDYDGQNIKRITNNGSINLSPQWSPDSSSIIYTSYKDKQPYLYMRKLSTGTEKKILDKPGINIGGRWSPDGKRIAATLSLEGNPELYILDIETRSLKRLTKNYGIDVSPSWSPDGKKLAFVSDIAGNPHIYVINSDGAGLRRLTYKGKYNTTPAWSPRGNLITFAGFNDGRFNIYTIRADGRGLKMLTSKGNNDTPSWSPDGRYIAFSSSRRNGRNNWDTYIMRADGTNQKKIISDMGNSMSPSWSPYFR